jgi:hypothetical protein
MFGMTKRQFLKRSKKALQETGVLTLYLRRLMNQETSAEINTTEAHRRMDALRRDVENTFSTYEKGNPPTECLNLHQEILNGLILFYDSIVTYSDYLQAKESHLEKEFPDLFSKTNENLKKYQELSLRLSREVDNRLNR